MYMNENLWYPWKAFLVSQGVLLPQSENRWSRGNILDFSGKKNLDPIAVITGIVVWR
jgi:hypothetical protein